MTRLVEFADANREKFPAIGYKLKKFQWTASIHDDGAISFIKADKNAQRTIPDISRSSGVKPILLTDKAEYVLQVDKENATEKNKVRTSQCHEAYMGLLKECFEETKSELILRVMKALEKRDWTLPSDMKPGDILVIKLDIDKFPHAEESVKNFWSRKVTPIADEAQNKICFICGKKAPAIERHSMEFSIGVDRTKLISANDNAYLSYGLKASEVAPTCFSCEQKYGQALSYMLRKHTSPNLKGGPHTFSVGGVTYVYWTRQNNDEVDDLISCLSDPDQESVKRILHSTYSGFENKVDTSDFCILALTANKARLVVRDYTEKPYWQIKEQLKQFFEAQDVGGPRLYGIYTLASSMYRDANKEIQKYAIKEWMGWALEGRELSGLIASHILKRIQAGGKMHVLHAAAIKSWLVSQNKEVWTVHVDETKKSDSYLCGRLFAVLEKVQEDAIGGNETIASRFFGSASTAPKSIFGMLIRNSQAHLSKIGKQNKGFEVNYSKRIQGILEGLEEFPTVLSLHEQAEFALGYYHEKQNLFKKKPKDEGEED
ncbi:type I-C CRISPR-associated protein Cas8c/Csd1 [Sporosarcina sp. FSL K6-3457]|uniref:type I-C CRISPR-associated protein Cas8c/Csd1 n=1 Tax=Sporosarcina sp. FSL K6-3457 TaxID=2978204 RepID=UPI0030FB1284